MMAKRRISMLFWACMLISLALAGCSAGTPADSAPTETESAPAVTESAAPAVDAYRETVGPTAQPAASGEVPGFEDIIGIWQDEENEGVTMTIDYVEGIAWKKTPHIWFDVGPGLEGTLYSADGGKTFSGALLAGDSTQPAFFIDISRNGYWLEVVYHDRSKDTEAKFVPVG